MATIERCGEAPERDDLALVNGYSSDTLFENLYDEIRSSLQDTLDDIGVTLTSDEWEAVSENDLIAIQPLWGALVRVLEARQSVAA